MLKAIFKVLFKVLLALGIVFAAFAVLQRLENQRSDYIEIYNNDDDDWGEDY